MHLRDLVQSLIAFDALAARQWVADAQRAEFRWDQVPRPEGFDAQELAIAAGVAEMLAERAGQNAPSWTEHVASAGHDIFLVRAAATMARLRQLCRDDGPAALRRRGIYAPPGFLSVA